MVESQPPNTILEASQQPLVELEQAGAETVDELSKRLKKVEGDLSFYRNDSRSIIYAVLIGAVLLIAAIGTEVILFHSGNASDMIDLQDQYFQEIKEVRDHNAKIEEELHIQQTKIESLLQARQATPK